MGTSYSASPSEGGAAPPAEGQEVCWNGYTISEIDSDSEEDAERASPSSSSSLAENQQRDNDNNNHTNEQDRDEEDTEADETDADASIPASPELETTATTEAASSEAEIIPAMQPEDQKEHSPDNPVSRDDLVPEEDVVSSVILPVTDDDDVSPVRGPPPPIAAAAAAAAAARATEAAAVPTAEALPALEPIPLEDPERAHTEDELETFFRELGLSEPGNAATGGRSVVSTVTDAATVSSVDHPHHHLESSFVPQPSRNFEWMNRSLETLVAGYATAAPILELPSRKKKRGKRHSHRRNSQANNRDRERDRERDRDNSNRSFSELDTGTVRTTPPTSPHGKSRRRSLDRCLDPFGSSSSHRYSDHHRIDGHRLRKRDGPNVTLNLLARETTGKRVAPRHRIPAPDRLRLMGGTALFNSLDTPSAGMCSEVTALEEAMDDGDWVKTQAVISRLSPRLIGDPTAAFLNSGNASSSHSRGASNDPNLPPTAPRFYAGGGRIGLERDAFVLAGGIDVLVRVFREPCFVGTEMARSYDARDLSRELVATNRLGHCWNESLACLRELVYAIPSLVETQRVFDPQRDDFLPFLFTLLAHDAFFDGAAALIEEILSLQSHSPQPEDPHEQQQSQQQQSQQQSQPPTQSQLQTSNSADSETSHGCGCDNNGCKPNGSDTPDEDATSGNLHGPTVRVSPPTTFYLGNVPDLYTLWKGFNCRQLAHFCRILALLIFEPEDRQLLESPAVLKSIELLQLRRNRAARAGRDSTVDMNQSILLGDERLVKRFLDLLAVMNFAPPLRCSSPFHIMAHFPYIADTLMMLGMHEFENWDDIARYDKMARKSLSSPVGENGERKELHDLGSVAGMLESLSDAFLNNEGEPTNQLGHIITVIGAAQQAGVVIGRGRQRTGNRMASQTHTNEEEPPPPRRDSNLEGLASAAGILTDQVLLRRSDHAMGQGDGSGNSGARSRVRTPEDAANVMQFNSLLLAPYQVEVLFVLCTLLGGRRKFDAQELLKQGGITKILDDMFQRLPWDSLSPTREPVSHRQRSSGNNATNNSHSDDQPGIHGPGCECTPESALCVQYLRLLHNFCDRDCDNYNGRRLLLSPVERRFIFQDCHIGSTSSDISRLAPGLLSKVIAAFIGESDESPYRFWLASCVESYLRGSSSVEQVFVAKTGLVEHLIEDITSQRLHCAGSLQTSFDLLGELCKGNIEVLRLLVGYLDNEEKFRKLMSVAASNLVDSNVFIRSLLLSLERMSYGNHFHDVGSTDGFSTITQEWLASNNVHSRGFLTHSWWETHLETPSNSSGHGDASDAATDIEIRRDQTRASDWFPAMENSTPLQQHSVETTTRDKASKGESFQGSVGRFGWVYKPERTAATTLGHSEHGGPDTIDRLSWFLTTNRTRLLRDLLEVVNLDNINHENICCLNTAVVITIFANRRNELDDLLKDLKQMDEDDHKARVYHSKLSLKDGLGLGTSSSTTQPQQNHNNNILQNFREVLWFWVEYYTHRGRDRLSLEFSSRLRFHEWMEVVTLLAADDGAPTALVRKPLPLPQSPYQRIA